MQINNYYLTDGVTYQLDFTTDRTTVDTTVSVVVSGMDAGAPVVSGTKSGVAEDIENSITLDLESLSPGKYTVEVWEDLTDASQFKLAPLNNDIFYIHILNSKVI